MVDFPGMRPKHIFYGALVVSTLFLTRSFGAWTDPTAGLPWLEYYSARQLGSDHPYQWFVRQDKLGRLLVGGSGLAVFDGQSWSSHAAGNSFVLRTIEFGADGRLWAGGLNELGYFTEPAVGRFEFHSLLGHLPETERQVGHIWGAGAVGEKVYFIGRETLYRWDGVAFKTWSFPGTSRLFPLKLGEETWFQHRENGLYR
jgi:hypothetical protein